ncbi:hypothetical protein [Sinomicrobium weinanense]|nr:hypothetical protein [Sinomicrobium weinanense]MBU3125375.1 hypothetical protein [Sinomicrobium weinanense]
MKRGYFILVVIFMVSCESYIYDEIDLENVFGVESAVEDKVYSYSEFAGFQGEGYIFNEYILTEETVSNFLKSTSKDTFPKKDEYKSKWELINWKKGLVLNDNIINMLSVFEGDTSNEDLQNQLEGLKDNIGTPNNYYSLFYKGSIEEPYSIELLIINPDNRSFWVVNIVT